MKWLTNLFKHLWADLTSPKAQAVEQQIEGLVAAAQPIVNAIAVLVPNKTTAEIEKAYATYGVPLAQQVASDPTSIGNAMENLAVAILRKNNQSVAASTLVTAVNLAVTGLKILMSADTAPAKAA